MVAKSYQGLKQLTEPYKHNGKMYVTIETKSGACKDVRWYSEAEYAKMYPDVKTAFTNDPFYRTQKDVLGFEKGYITIFKGVTANNEEWFEHKQECRWARNWGWYVPSTIAVPCDYPQGVQEIKLIWDNVGGEDGRLLIEDEVRKAVGKALLAATAKTTVVPKPQWKIGERLDLVVKVIGKQTEENKHYNSKTHFYELQDQKGNYYKWKTAAKDWSVGSKHHIRGTVKDFDELNGEACTVLTRCLEQ
jgi:hypothetical protein